MLKFEYVILVRNARNGVKKLYNYLQLREILANSEKHDMLLSIKATQARTMKLIILLLSFEVRGGGDYKKGR